MTLLRLPIERIFFVAPKQITAGYDGNMSYPSFHLRVDGESHQFDGDEYEPVKTWFCLFVSDISYDGLVNFTNETLGKESENE